jgi:hypothetical protein
MRCRCPASPVPVVPVRLGMLGAAVTGWLLLLNGVRCAQAVIGSNSAMMVMICFMLASIARVQDNVNSHEFPKGDAVLLLEEPHKTLFHWLAVVTFYAVYRVLPKVLLDFFTDNRAPAWLRSTHPAPR